MRILFVCLGNICRSPTAEAVLRLQVARRGLSDRVEVDSSGLVDHHVGDPPDSRSIAAAAARGYDLTSQRARRVEPADFERFDFVLSLDASVQRTLEEMAPRDARARVLPFLGLDEDSAARDVPDPYYGGPEGFDDVLDLIEAGAAQLLDRVERVLDGADLKRGSDA